MACKTRRAVPDEDGRLNPAAVQAGNDAVGGRELSMSAADYPDRVRWMDAYIAAGGAWECADPAGRKAGAPVGGCPEKENECGGTIEIQINNTSTSDDDLVQLKCDHPSQRHTVPCRMRVTGSSKNVSIVLTNPDGRLRFPNAADTTHACTLPSSGSWVPFEISGERPSSRLNDAVIEAHAGSATGRVCATKHVTVFWFDQARMQVTQGGQYVFVGTRYTATGGPAVSYSSTARLRPAGVKCTAPQVRDLRVAIMQHIDRFNFTVTWSTPGVAWEAWVPAGTRLTAPSQMRLTVTFGPAVAYPVNDGARGAHPLYSIRAAALQPPTGCTGAAAATTSDTPSHSVPPSYSQNYQIGGRRAARVTWIWRQNTTRVEDFQAFCALWNQTTRRHCALRQAPWELDIDSGAAAAQRADVHADAAVTVDPSTGPQANTVHHSSTYAAVGAATTAFTKP